MPKQLENVMQISDQTEVKIAPLRLLRLSQNYNERGELRFT